MRSSRRREGFALKWTDVLTTQNISLFFQETKYNLGGKTKNLSKNKDRIVNTKH